MNGLPASSTGFPAVTSPPKPEIEMLPRPLLSAVHDGVPTAGETKTPLVLLAASISVLPLSKKKANGCPLSTSRASSHSRRREEQATPRRRGTDRLFCRPMPALLVPPGGAADPRGCATHRPRRDFWATWWTGQAWTFCRIGSARSPPALGPPRP